MADDSISLKVSVGPVTHMLSLPATSLVRDVKDLLWPLTGAAPDQQRLIFKGKERKPDEALSAIGIVEGSKAMLLFAAGFVRPPASAQPAADANRSLSDLPAAAPFAAVETGTTPAPIEAGAALGESRSSEPVPVALGKDGLIADECDGEGVQINISCLGEVRSICVAPRSVTRDVKLRVAGKFGIPISQQRLIYKGKVLTDDELLELKQGGKMAVSCTEGFHLEAEGARAVQSMVQTTLILEGRLASIQRKQKHRLTDSHELLAALGALDEEAHAAVLDLSNARVKPAVETQRKELLGRMQRLLETTQAMRRGTHA